MTTHFKLDNKILNWVSQSIVNSDLKSDLNQFTNTFPESVKLAIQRKTVDLATESK
jgi:hypothetical protein